MALWNWFIKKVKFQVGDIDIYGGKFMEYITAIPDMADAVRNVLHTTIKAIYPKYYPKEVSDFFAGIIARNTF